MREEGQLFLTVKFQLINVEEIREIESQHYDPPAMIAVAKVHLRYKLKSERKRKKKMKGKKFTTLKAREVE